MAAVLAALLIMEAMEVDYDTDSDDGSFSDIFHILSGSDSWYSGSPGSVDFSTESDDQSTPDDTSEPELEIDDAAAVEGDDVSEASSSRSVSQEVIVEIINDMPQPTGENGAQAFVTECVPLAVDEGKTPIKIKVETNQCSQSPGGEDEGQNCPICFDEWTSSGTHRLVSLKCGHLFGLSCIERWLRGSKLKCPQCNASAKKSDIRTLYVKNLKALDTSERDQALRDLEKEKELRRRAELEAANTRMKLQMSVQECEKLKKDLMDHQTLLQNLRSSRKRGSSTQDTCSYASKTSKTPSFLLEKTLDINKDGGCRVLGMSSFFPMLVITQASTNKVFAGYGIKKVSTLDMKPAEFVSIHQKPIKDLAFHSHDALILTAGLDKTIKLTNVYSNTVVQTYSLAVDPWSCIWNRDDATCFYAGLKNGTILQFDTRMTSTHVQQLPSTGHTSPVVGLQYVEKKATSPLSISGPVTLQLSACCFYENRCSDGYKVHPLPVEGHFTSLCLEPSSGHFLVSCRPSVKHPKVTHMFCELACTNASMEPSVIDNTCTFNVIQTLHGGGTQVQLSRSKAFLNPGNECSVLVCAGDDDAQAALIWDVNTGQCLQHLKADSTILDVWNFRINENHFLSTLTERTLRVYRWIRA